MAKQLKAAVIGTSIGTSLHIPALQAADFDVTMLAGRNSEKTARYAAKFNIPTSVTSVDAVIDSDVDVIVVASPPETHPDFVIRAIAAGKHVMCEKPLALGTAATREMRDAAVSSNVATALGYQFRWRLGPSMMREVVRSGKLGELIRGSFEWDHPMTAHPGPLDIPDWWFKPETGGGWLRNWNSHGIDLVRYMIGDFAAVSGVLHPDLARGMSADDTYSFAFVMKNGMQGVMQGSCRAWEFQERNKLVGSDATLLVDNDGEPNARILLIDPKGRHLIEPSAELLREMAPVVPRTKKHPAQTGGGEGGYVEAHADNANIPEQTGFYRAFLRHIHDRSYKHPAVADFNDGVAAVDVIDAVEKSHREGRWVDVG